MKYNFSIIVEEVEGQRWHVIMVVTYHAGRLEFETWEDSDGDVERWVARRMQEVWGL